MTNPGDPYQPQQGYGPPGGYGPAGGGSGWGTPPPYGGVPPYGGTPQTSTRAIVALVLAIGSFVVCPVIPAVVALVVASSARQEIYASGGRLGGLGLVTAAKVIAWVHLGLALLAILLIVVGFSMLSVGGVHTV